MASTFSQEVHVAVNDHGELYLNRYLSPTLQLCAMLNATCVLSPKKFDNKADVFESLRAGSFDLSLPRYAMTEPRLDLCRFSNPLFESQYGILISKPMFQFCFNPLHIFGPVTWIILAVSVLLLVCGDSLWRHCLAKYGNLKHSQSSVLLRRERQFRCIVLWCLIALVGAQINAKAKSLLAIRCSERQFFDVASIVAGIRQGKLNFVNVRGWNAMDVLVNEIHRDQKPLLSRAFASNPPKNISGANEMFQAFRKNSVRRAFEENRIFVALTLNSARHFVRKEPRILRYASFLPIDTKQWSAFPIAKNASWRFVEKVNVAVVKMIEVGFLEKYDRQFAMFQEKTSAEEIEVKAAVEPLKAGQYALLFYAFAVGVLVCGIAFAFEVFCKFAMRRIYGT